MLKRQLPCGYAFTWPLALLFQLTCINCSKYPGIDTKPEIISNTCPLFWKAASALEKTAFLFSNPLKDRWFENLPKHFLQIQVVLERYCRSIHRKADRRTECITMGHAVSFGKGSSIDKPGFHLVN